MNWLYWVLPLISLGALLCYLLPSGRETVRPVTTSQSAADPTPGVLTKSAYLASAPDNWVSIGCTPNGFVNKDIYSRNGEQLGTIKDVLVGLGGTTAAAIINVGRYLGIGDKEIAVPFSALQVE